MIALRAEGLSKHWGGLKAVDGVSLELDEGQILGLIGPNGAGKSTMFAMLAGSLVPTAGRVFLGDVEISRRPAFRIARAGVVRTHQIVRPFAGLTVLENAVVGGLHARRFEGEAHDPEALAWDALRFVGLDRRANDYPPTLTLAGRKRLELARALALRPKILLLDEVIAGVNPTEAEEMVSLIRRARDDRRISIIMTEHVMPAVMSLSDRVIVLDAGKLIAAGTPHEVVSNRAVVAAYLGDAHAKSEGAP